MINAQIWLNEKYSNPEQVQEISNFSDQNLEVLEGELNIVDFPNLERINLGNSKNLIKLTITNCSQIKWIDIFDNQIVEINGLNNLLELEYLNCADNQLTTLDISNNAKLKSLFCFNNPQLAKEDFKGVEKLVQLKQFNCDEDLKASYESQIQQIEQQLNQVQNNLNQQITGLTNELNDTRQQLIQARNILDLRTQERDNRPNISNCDYNQLIEELDNKKEENRQLTIEEEEIASELINKQNELNVQRDINTIIQQEKENLEREFRILKERKETIEKLLENIQEERNEYKAILQEEWEKLERLQTEHEITVKLNAEEQIKNEKLEKRLEKRLEKVENRFGKKLTEIKQLKEQLQNQDQLQNEVQQLRTKLINYAQFIFQGILAEQERIKNSISNNSWFVALEKQQKIISQLKEIFGNELNNEQLRTFLQLQEQLASLQTQLYKIQIKKMEEQTTHFQISVIQQPPYKNY